MSILEVKNLTIGYGKEIIKENINFSVDEGDYFCIVGANGAGKSTLLKTLLGIKKKISGEIIYSKDIDKTSLGYIAQSIIVSKDFPASVYEIVVQGLCGHRKKIFGLTNDEKIIIDNSIKKLGLSDIINKNFNELSGGQKQRVLLARALVATNKIIFLDEPVAGLDPKITNELYEIVYELNKNENITIIMISHDVEMVKKYATKILYFDEKGCEVK